MFIKINERRINLRLILEYKPYDKEISEKTLYFIRLKYNDNKFEDLSFIEDKNKRDIFLTILDKNLMINNE